MPAVSDIAFVRYAVPDLDRMEQFLLDFGLHTVRKDATALYSRACGDAPFCHVAQKAEKPATLGFGLYAQSAADLAEIAREFGASVEDSPEPGGGQRVRLTDPAGFKVDIVHDSKLRNAAAKRQVAIGAEKKISLEFAQDIRHAVILSLIHI